VRLIAEGALAREESRGAHLRLDFPDLDPTMDGRHVMLVQRGKPQTETWA
jgi:succinate dehydrogenase/fumarate reductase flavoprotein subunit